MITGASFYCPDLVINTPSIEPSIVLPNSGGADLCLLESEEYPTPLVAVAMTGSGPGVCVISTSWQKRYQLYPGIEAVPVSSPAERESLFR